MRSTLKIATLALLGLCSQAWAGPLQRADVVAEPAWVFHLDVDTLRTTAVGKFILEQMNKPESDNKLAALHAMAGVDLRTAVHGLTLYSAGPAPQDGVLVVYADFDANRLATLARGAKDYQSVSHRNHTIQHWVDEKKKAGADGVKPRTYSAIHGQRVIFGQRQTAVAAVLDVFDGVAPRLSQSQVFPTLGSGSGFLEAAARKIDMPTSDPNAAVFKMAQLMTLKAAEENQAIQVNFAMHAADEEIATQMTSVAQGLVSLMKLNRAKPEDAKIAEALTLKQDGAVLNVTFSMPGTQVVEIMKAAEARKQAASQ